MCRPAGRRHWCVTVDGVQYTFRPLVIASTELRKLGVHASPSRYYAEVYDTQCRAAGLTPPPRHVRHDMAPTWHRCGITISLCLTISGQGYIRRTIDPYPNFLALVNSWSWMGVGLLGMDDDMARTWHGHGANMARQLLQNNYMYACVLVLYVCPVLRYIGSILRYPRLCLRDYTCMPEH
jgi:hypothetical protein